MKTEKYIDIVTIEELIKFLKDCGCPIMITCHKGELGLTILDCR